MGDPLLLESARCLILVISLIGIALWTYITVKSKTPGWFFASTLWLMNLSLFVIARMLELDLSPIILNAWSLGVHLQGALTITGGAIVMIVAWRKSDA